MKKWSQTTSSLQHSRSKAEGPLHVSRCIPCAYLYLKSKSSVNYRLIIQVNIFLTKAFNSIHCKRNRLSQESDALWVTRTLTALNDSYYRSKCSFSLLFLINPHQQLVSFCLLNCIYWHLNFIHQTVCSSHVKVFQKHSISFSSGLILLASTPFLSLSG